MNDSPITAELAEKIARYQPSEATKQLIQTTPMLLLVGFTGAGKDTIARELFKTNKYHPIVSHTTRQPRMNNGVPEQDGVEYHFITLAQAEHMLDRGSYVEANMYGGNIYGTSVAEIQAAHDTHKIAATDLEVQGVAEYMAIDPNVKAAFVLPPNFDRWQERLLKRYGAAADHHDIHKRMHTALQELEHALRVPYFHFVINDSLPAAVADADRIANGVPGAEQKEAAADLAQALCESLKRHLALL